MDIENLLVVVAFQIFEIFRVKREHGESRDLR